MTEPAIEPERSNAHRRWPWWAAALLAAPLQEAERHEVAVRVILEEHPFGGGGQDERSDALAIFWSTLRRFQDSSM